MSPSEAAPAATPPVRPWRATDPVVDARLVRNRKVAIPAFGADVWNLACLGGSENLPTERLDFKRLPAHWRLAAKEIVAQRINEPVPRLRSRGNPGPAGPKTCQLLLGGMATAFAFMDRRGISSIPDLEPRHVDAFVTEIAATARSPGWRMRLLKVFDVFRESRDHLSGGGLAFHPLPGKSLAGVCGWEEPEENLTDRIPEDVMAPLLAWALAYVEVFSIDIFRLLEERRRGPSRDLLVAAARDAIAVDRDQFKAERERRKRGLPARDMPILLKKRLAHYLAGLRARGEGLPAKVRAGKVVPDFERIGIAAGVPREFVGKPDTRGRAALAASGLELRVRDHGHGVVKLPGAREAWHGKFTLHDLEAECRRLQVAAYVVVAYLSGMRDDEVQTLRRGCVSIMRDEAGRIYRHKIAGTTWKTAGRLPRRRRWVVIKPVADAVRVLERLADDILPGRDRFLFMRRRHDDLGVGLFRKAINDELNAFQTHCRKKLVRRQAGAAMPPFPSGAPFRLKASQFRRTLAWHIANQPFGEVAGMIQYGHCSVQMFEGYAGTKTSGFTAEVANEEALARLLDVEEMYRKAGDGVRPAGPMAEELAAYLARVREEIGDFPGRVAEARDVRELLRDKAADLHVGPYVHCFYKPGKARCEASSPTGGREAPVIARCDPDCGNACWTRKHLEAWRAVAAECGAMTKTNRLPTRQLESLRRQKKVADRVIAAIVDADPEARAPGW